MSWKHLKSYEEPISYLMEYYSLDFFGVNATKCQAVPLSVFPSQHRMYQVAQLDCGSAGQKLISMLIVHTNVL